MHLYLDTYISEIALSPNRRLESFLRDVQSNSYTYRRQSKIDILKYTIASYAELAWSGVTIRIDGDEKEKIRELGAYIEECIPTAKIYFERSDSGRKYVNALEPMLENNPWIFFSPNNDHPYIHKDVNYLKTLQVSGENAEKKYGMPVAILYSHFTESLNSIFPNRYLYGYTGDFPEVIHEDENSYWVLRNQTPLLSTHIYRSNELHAMMEAAGNSRVIRTECLGKFLTKNTQTIQIVPKQECCRHYDAYMHTAFVVRDFISANRVPPLFIPDGFFDNDIKIKYGYESYFPGYVNVNPEKISYIFEAPDGTDLGVLKDDLPAFWSKRISNLEVNPEFVSVNGENSFLTSLVINPWYSYTQNSIALAIAWRKFFFAFVEPIAGGPYHRFRRFISNQFVSPIRKFFNR